jgi:predicted dehydrogenase
MTGPVKVGVIGAGNISDQYLRNLVGYPDVEVVAVADLDLERAREQAAKHGVASAGTVAELLARPDIELVLNLTIPRAHAEVARSAVEAGKHVWGEKPITMDRVSARRLLDAARQRGVLVGNAPDTVLGDGIQTSRRLLEQGRIGTPQTVLTIMQGPGPDAWHPRPQFLFARGAGPLFDIGPYHVATMAHLLGPIERVQASGHRAREVRTVGSGPDAGATFPVEVHTHVSVLIRFESGVVGTSLLSFDSPLRRQTFEITGTEGTLKVPVDSFDGASEIMPAGSADQVWEQIAAPGEPRGFGVGALEMARALRAGNPPRASGALAYHVLDAMLAIEESIESGGPVTVDSSFQPTPALPAGWDTRTRTL